MKANKTWARFDSNGKLIPGSTINAPKKPVNGSWKEITDNTLCCSPYTELTATPEDVTTTTPGVGINFSTPNGQIYATFTCTLTTDISDFVDKLNDNLSWMGRFSVAGNGTDVVLKLKDELLLGETVSSFTIIVD